MLLKHNDLTEELTEKRENVRGFVFVLPSTAFLACVYLFSVVEHAPYRNNNNHLKPERKTFPRLFRC